MRFDGKADCFCTGACSACQATICATRSSMTTLECIAGIESAWSISLCSQISPRLIQPIPKSAGCLSIPCLRTGIDSCSQCVQMHRVLSWHATPFSRMFNPESAMKDPQIKALRCTASLSQGLQGFCHASAYLGSTIGACLHSTGAAASPWRWLRTWWVTRCGAKALSFASPCW